jgi:hypothetical protein
MDLVGERVACEVNLMKMVLCRTELGELMMKSFVGFEERIPHSCLI